MPRAIECYACGALRTNVEYSIHKDGFGEGPEVPLCPKCGSKRHPTCEELWDMFKGARFVSPDAARTFASFAMGVFPERTYRYHNRYVLKVTSLGRSECVDTAEVKNIRERGHAIDMKEEDYA